VSTSWQAIGIVVGATLLSGLAPTFLKRGAEKFTINLKKLWAQPSLLLLNYWLFMGVGLDVLSAILNVIALKYGELSVLTPVTSLTYIWACLFSGIFLKERMTRRKWLGVALIVFGVVLVTLGMTAQ
jgi:uncharacterized membrane protein